MFDGLVDIIVSAFSKLGEIIINWLLEGLLSLLGWVCFIIISLVCTLINIIYEMFGVLAGLETVTYTAVNASGATTTQENYLINIFFQHSTINNLYWGMALIGMVMAFAFTMIAVVKKAGDLNGNQKASMGQILGTLGKSILLMICMNLIIGVTLTATNVLLQSISALFDNPYTVTQESKKTFTSDDYKTMNEIFQTIGTYSLNGAYSSRYNVNSCFNAIRPKLLHLQENNMFNVYYTTSQAVVVNGVTTTREIETWQSALQKIVRSVDLTQDVKLDVYHEELSQAMLDVMDILRYNQSSFKPLESYEAYYQANDKPADIGTIIFLSGTTEAAHNSAYNTNGSLTDPVRGPYYLGMRSIYDYGQVSEDFVTKFGGIQYIMIAVLCYGVLKELIVVMLACIVRIFQMLLLYISAPPILAIMPLDGGEKFKQWTTAFVIQNFSIFATVISMRLLMLFVPIVFSSNLVLFDNFLMNILCKILIVFGGFKAVGKSSGLITGILANNAGMQAIQAGDTRGDVKEMKGEIKQKWEEHKQKQKEKEQERKQKEQEARQSSGGGAASMLPASNGSMGSGGYGGASGYGGTGGTGSQGGTGGAGAQGGTGGAGNKGGTGGTGGTPKNNNSMGGNKPGTPKPGTPTTGSKPGSQGGMPQSNNYVRSVSKSQADQLSKTQKGNMKDAANKMNEMAKGSGATEVKGGANDNNSNGRKFSQEQQNKFFGAKNLQETESKRNGGKPGQGNPTDKNGGKDGQGGSNGRKFTQEQKEKFFGAKNLQETAGKRGGSGLPGSQGGVGGDSEQKKQGGLSGKLVDMYNQSAGGGGVPSKGNATDPNNPLTKLAQNVADKALGPGVVDLGGGGTQSKKFSVSSINSSKGEGDKNNGGKPKSKLTQEKADHLFGKGRFDVASGKVNKTPPPKFK